MREGGEPSRSADPGVPRIGGETERAEMTSINPRASLQNIPWTRNLPNPSSPLAS
jgi:hypothetical protein